MQPGPPCLHASSVQPPSIEPPPTSPPPSSSPARPAPSPPRPSPLRPSPPPPLPPPAAAPDTTPPTVALSVTEAIGPDTTPPTVALSVTEAIAPGTTPPTVALSVTEAIAPGTTRPAGTVLMPELTASHWLPVPLLSDSMGSSATVLLLLCALGLALRLALRAIPLCTVRWRLGLNRDAANVAQEATPRRSARRSLKGCKGSVQGQGRLKGGRMERYAEVPAQPQAVEGDEYAIDI
jgi:hypothetical protein